MSYELVRILAYFPHYDVILPEKMGKKSTISEFHFLRSADRMSLAATGNVRETKRAQISSGIDLNGETF